MKAGFEKHLQETAGHIERLEGGEDYEVQYLAEKMDISVNLARELIKKHGNDRATLEREAKKLI